MYTLAKQIVKTDKPLHSFSVFESVAVKHFMRSDKINHLCSSKMKMPGCLHFYFSYLVSKSNLFCTILYCHLWPVGAPNFTSLSLKQYKFKKKIIEHKMF
jgi:hypothetical protein